MRTMDQRVCNFNFRYMYWNHVEKIWKIGTTTVTTTAPSTTTTPAPTGDYSTVLHMQCLSVHQYNYCQVTPPCSLWAARAGTASRWRSSPPPPAQQRTAPSSLCPRVGWATPSTRGRCVEDTAPAPAPAASGSSLTVAGPRPSHSNNPG